MVKTRWRDKDSSATKRREALRKEENKQARRESTQVKQTYLPCQCSHTLRRLATHDRSARINYTQAEFLTTATTANARQAVLHRISETHQEIIFVQPVTGKYAAASKASVREPLLKKGGNPFALLSAMSGSKRKSEEAESATPAPVEVAPVSASSPSASASGGDNINAAEDGKKRRKRSKQRSGAAVVADAE